MFILGAVLIAWFLLVGHRHPPPPPNTKYLEFPQNSAFIGLCVGILHHDLTSFYAQVNLLSGRVPSQIQHLGETNMGGFHK